jgi:hypothetical protein
VRRPCMYPHLPLIYSIRRAAGAGTRQNSVGSCALLLVRAASLVVRPFFPFFTPFFDADADHPFTAESGLGSCPVRPAQKSQTDGRRNHAVQRFRPQSFITCFGFLYHRAKVTPWSKTASARKVRLTKDRLCEHISVCQRVHSSLELTAEFDITPGLGFSPASPRGPISGARPFFPVSSPPILTILHFTIWPLLLPLLGWWKKIARNHTTYAVRRVEPVEVSAQFYCANCWQLDYSKSEASYMCRLASAVIFNLFSTCLHLVVTHSDSY